MIASLLSISLLLGACDTAEEEEDETEEPEQEGTEEEDETEEVEEVEEEIEVEAESVTFEHELYDHSQDEIVEVAGEVGPIVVDEDYAILPITIDTEEDTQIDFSNLFDLGLGSGEGIASRRGFDIRLVDTLEHTASHIGVQYVEDGNYTALQTFLGEGSRSVQQNFGEDLDPTRFYAVYDIPESESVHALFAREVGLVEEIPVVERNESGTITFTEMEEELEQELGEDGDEDEANEILQERLGEVVPTVDEIIEEEISDNQELTDIHTRTEAFETYYESVDTSVSRIDEVENSTLILSADVLFEFDEADLTDEADEELEAAISELEGVEGGELEIVGHTDNEGSEDYNQELSEDRAASVEERLNELTDLDQFDEVNPSGESLREPIADNETEEGRQQNRRVELQFTPPTEEVEREVDSELPEALGEEAEFPDSVQTQYGDLEVLSVHQVDDVFVGRIQARPNEEGNDYDIFTQVAGIGARGWHADEAGNYSQWTAYPITMIHDGRQYFPIDYYLTPLEDSHAEEQIEEAENDVEFIVPLADRYTAPFGRVQDEDGFHTITVIWPAVDSESVTVDLPHSDVHGDSDGQIERTAPWRITDVPIEEADEAEFDLDDPDDESEEETDDDANEDSEDENEEDE